jgi:hypothetical protein
MAVPLSLNCKTLWILTEKINILQLIKIFYFSSLNNMFFYFYLLLPLVKVLLENWWKSLQILILQ